MGIAASGRHFVLAMITMLALAGCTTSVRPHLAYGNLPYDTQFDMVPAGNFSMVTQRTVGSFESSQTQDRVLCVSPSPDWATSLATARALSGSANTPSGVSASLSANANTTETLAQMAGRTAGVVALRDGLYQACQAYANGQIGRNAYAVILSQYGNLLNSLVGGQTGPSASTATTAASAATPSSVSVSVAGSSPLPTASGAGGAVGSNGGATSAYSEKVAILQQEHVQALVVACLNASDPRFAAFREYDTILGSKDCPTLIHEIVKATPALLAPQNSATPAAANQKEASCPKPVATSVPIAAYQGVLKNLGLYKGALAEKTGKIGPMTASALKAYQTAKGLCVSGVPDAATMAAMNLKI